MRRSCQATIVALMILPNFAAAAADFDGTWKSKPESWKVTTPDEYVLLNGNYTCVAGCYMRQTLPADGAFHAVTGVAYYDSEAVSVVDDHTVRFTTKKNGAKMLDEAVSASADGKTLTITFSNAANTNGGPPVTGTFSEVRVGAAPSGAHVISGKWQFSGTAAISDNAVLTTYRLEGDTLTMTQPTGQSYVAVLGGPDAPYKGDAGIDAVSLRRTGPHAIEETDKLHGAVIWVGTSTVSDDGTTMTTVWQDMRNNTGGSGIATKQ